MAKYEVGVSIYTHVTVEADNNTEAIEKAKEQVNIPIDWELSEEDTYATIIGEREMLIEDDNISESCAECEEECSEKCLLFRAKLTECNLLHEGMIVTNNWIDLGEGDYKCPVCKQKFIFGLDKDAMLKAFPYCPKCNTKMEGDN